MKNLIKENWKILILSLVTFLNGILDIALVLTSRLSCRVHFFGSLVPFWLHYSSRLLTLIFGFLFIYFSFNLLQRKKIAWLVVTFISVLSVFTHIGKGNSLFASISPLLMLLLLFLWRKIFIVKSESTSIFRAIVLVFIILLIVIVYGTLGFYLLDVKEFGINFNFLDSIIRALKELFLIGNSDLIPRTRHARWFLESFQWLGTTTIILIVYSLFQPVKYRFLTLPHEKEKAKEILEKYSFSVDDYFKLSSDKSYFFSKDQQAFLAYKTISGVAVILNDPTGPPEKNAELTENFLQFCFENGWGAIFINIFPNFLEIYKKLGLRTIKIGEEAVIDLEHFYNFTANKKSFRKIKHRFEREGYKTIRYLPPQQTDILNELEEVSNEWLTLPGRKERSFALGRFDRNYIENTPISVVRDPKNRIIAFINEMPVYIKGEATIDMMRHRVNIPNNTMEFLFLELLEILKNGGNKRFSLGLAPFVGIGEKPESNIEEKALRFLSRYLNQLFSYKGLRMFKDKFEPNWEERFVVYTSGLTHLFRTIIATYKALEV